MSQEEYNKMMQAEMIKKAATLNYMTREARERYNNVRIAHPEIAEQALMMILQGVQTGRIRMVDEPMLKSILTSIINNKK